MLRRVFSLGVLAAFVACAEDQAGPPLGSARQAIVNGIDSDASQDSTVMLLVTTPDGSERFGICSGTLIAPRLVITARHCVALVDNVNSIACDSNGTPLSGGGIRQNLPPSSFHVFTGVDRPRFIGQKAPELDLAQAKPAAGAEAVIDDKSGTLCNHDVALLLLKTPITDRPIATLRLDRDPEMGEEIINVGWGVTNDTEEPPKRRQRVGAKIEGLGPSDSYPVLTKSEFRFGESICNGDSGGPVFSARTKALIGIVSRGGNGVIGTGAETCYEAFNLGTKLSPFRQLIDDAMLRAGSTPKLEPAPEDDGCTIGRPGRASSGVALVGATLALALLRRRSRGSTKR